MNKLIKHISATLLIVLAGFVTPLMANELPAMERKVSLSVREQPVQQFLETLFAQVNVPVTVSEEIEGLMNGRFDGTAREVFDKVASAFNVSLYFDGVVAHVYSGSEIKRTLMPVSALTAGRVEKIAHRMNLGDRNNKIDAGNGGLIVTGTRRFLEQIEELSFSVQSNDKESTKKAPLAYRVFYLSNAWAADTSFDVGGESVTISGVATLLSELVNDGELPVSIQSRRTNSNGGSLEGLRGKGLQAVASPGVQPLEIQSEAEIEPAFSQSNTGARIVADSRLNAVIIRDAADRMQAYQALINDLDRPSQMVEIEATIIDVNTDKTRELGVGWQYRRSDGVLSSIGGTANGQTGTVFPGSPIQGAGAVLSTVLGAKEQFLSRIRALEEKGAARVVSKPHVITLSDVEAVLGATTEFFVRVAGDEEVDLFNVPVGTVLRVTPHVFQESGQSRIKLLVNIEDGAASSREVDQIPVIERANINTQAVINEGDSLLIGGLVRDSYQEVASGVPLLGSIPFLGRLFKSTSSSSNRVERLFMITPRSADGLGFGRVQNGKRTLPVLQGDMDDIEAQAADRISSRPQPFGKQVEDIPFNPLYIQRDPAPAALPRSPVPGPGAPAGQQPGMKADPEFKQWVAISGSESDNDVESTASDQSMSMNNVGSGQSMNMGSSNDNSQWTTVPVAAPTNGDGTSESKKGAVSADGWMTIE